MKSNKNKVIITGVGPLMIRLAGIFSNALICLRIFMPGDSLAKAKSIMLFKETAHRGTACNLILLMSHVILTLALNILDKPVNRCFALLSAFVKLIRATIQGLNMLYRFTISEPVPESILQYRTAFN